MKKQTILSKIFTLYYAIGILCVIIGYLVIVDQIKINNINMNKTRLVSISKYLLDDLKNVPIHDTSKINSSIRKVKNFTGCRVTVIDNMGNVISDTDKDPKKMENHLYREEIKAALKGKEDTVVRKSDTLNTTMLYHSIPLKINGQVKGVIRVSMKMDNIKKEQAGIFHKLLILAIVFIVFGGILIFYITKIISEPLRNIDRATQELISGNQDSIVSISETKEYASIATSINSLNKRIISNTEELRSAYAVQSSILSNMHEGVIAIDNDDNILVINPAAFNILNIKSKSIEKKPTLESIRHSEFISNLNQVQKENRFIECEINVVATEQYIDFAGDILEDQNGNKIGYLVVINDITETKKLENMRSEFVANVSHELKTPITSVKGYLETLIEGVSEEQRVDFLNTALKHTNRLADLVDDILFLSKIEHNDVDLSNAFSNQNIDALLSYVIGSYSKIALDNNVNLTYSCEDNVVARVNASLLEQAVNNLLDNAIKYAENGNVNVRLYKKSDGFCISVEDTGCGIPKEHLDRIFERFYRVDKNRSKKLGGTGLGLAIVKYICKIHGGYVSVKSKVGEGSKFKITIPL